MGFVQDTRLIPGILTGLLGAFLLYHGSQMPHPRGWASSPGLFPIIIGAVLIGLALLLLIERWRDLALERQEIDKKDNDAKIGDITPGAKAPFLKGDLTAVLAISAGLSAYILALEFLPYEPVTLLSLAIGMWAFGARSLLYIALGASAFTLVIVLLFTQVLGTLIPGTSSLIDTLFQ
jgi:hypothetical protein